MLNTLESVDACVYVKKVTVIPKKGPKQPGWGSKTGAVLTPLLQSQEDWKPRIWKTRPGDLVMPDPFG